MLPGPHRTAPRGRHFPGHAARVAEVEQSRHHRLLLHDQGTRRSRTPVQIGGGGHGHLIPGFFNIDIVPPADLVWDVRESLPVRDSTVDFLFSEHFLEHIDYPHSVKNYITELHRVTTPGCHVVTGVPDAELVINAYHQRPRILPRHAAALVQPTQLPGRHEYLP
jgi:hypothetical protein